MSESSANGKRTRYANQSLALPAARRGVAHTEETIGLACLVIGW